LPVGGHTSHSAPTGAGAECEAMGPKGGVRESGGERVGRDAALLARTRSACKAGPTPRTCTMWRRVRRAQAQPAITNNTKHVNASPPIAPVLRVGPLSRGQPTPSEMHSNARNFSSLLYPSHIRPNSWGELSIFRTPPYNLTRFHNAQHCSLQHLANQSGSHNASKRLQCSMRALTFA